MNPLYDQLMGGQRPQQMFVRQPMSPIQKVSAVMQAMQNPAAFVRQMIPDLPNEIANDPNKILQYLQQTRGITNEQIRQIAGQIPNF